MQLFVLLDSPSSWTMEWDRETTVDDLYAFVEKKLPDRCPLNYRLIGGGKQMSGPNRTLIDCGLKQNSTVRLVWRSAQRIHVKWNGEWMKTLDGEHYQCFWSELRKAANPTTREHNQEHYWTDSVLVMHLERQRRPREATCLDLKTVLAKRLDLEETRIRLSTVCGKVCENDCAIESTPLTFVATELPENTEQQKPKRRRVMTDTKETNVWLVLLQDDEAVVREYVVFQDRDRAIEYAATRYENMQTVGSDVLDQSQRLRENTFGVLDQKRAQLREKGSCAATYEDGGMWEFRILEMEIGKPFKFI